MESDFKLTTPVIGHQGRGKKFKGYICAQYWSDVAGKRDKVERRYDVRTDKNETIYDLKSSEIKAIGEARTDIITLDDAKLNQQTFRNDQIAKINAALKPKRKKFFFF